jgi:diadenosine tetraphosphate (Ap4A) HIT family hydrolase
VSGAPGGGAGGSPGGDPACELCAGDGGAVLWRDALLRVVAVADPDYPGFLRLVCNAHVREWTDLAPAQRARFGQALALAESAVREVLAPDKINLASLGNQTPHLHWHVIPRWADDAHFPQPIWGRRQREPDAARLAARHAAARSLPARLAQALARELA